MILIAKEPILHENTQYEPGDMLPQSDKGYVNAWLEAGSARWAEIDDFIPAEARKPKAQMVTAKAGQTGIASPSTGQENDLAGRVPEGKVRGVVKEPSKRAPKKQS